MDRILFIPSARRGNGTGHLKRCARWSMQLPRQNFYIPRDPGIFPLEEIHRLTAGCVNRNIFRSNPGSDWDLVVLDNRKTGISLLPAEILALPILAVDEAGPMRDQVSYALDTLPGLYDSPPNRQGTGFLDLPERNNLRKAEQRSEVKKILVSFGGEDPAGLTGPLLSALLNNPGNRENWSVVEGPSFRDSLSLPPGERGITLLKAPENLKDQFWKYDIVICSFGLTAFEAIASGCSVLLVNPGYYHDKLSEKAGFPFIPESWSEKPSSLLGLIRQSIEREEFRQVKRILQEEYCSEKENFINWISSLSPSANRCPVCGSLSNRSLFRFENKSYFKCGSSDCAMVYMLNFREKKDIYSSAYFFEDYRKQYGKTYLQDFQHIRKNGMARLRQIARYRGKHKTLLDIGCAFGPFLDAAREEGYDCYGIDVSKEAVSYIRQQLTGIQAEVSAFENFDLSGTFGLEQFDIITLWYVIEHFKDLNRVLSDLSRMISEDGVLALSTPHGKGVSGRMKREEFFRNSPDDHYTVWDRNSARKVLKRFGFYKIRFVVTGYHPERIPLRLPFRVFLNRFPLLWFCRLFKLGDTFEIYAVKKRKNR